MPRITRNALHEADPTFLWKLVLRSSAIILASIAAGLIGWALSHPIVPDLGPIEPEGGSVGYSRGDFEYQPFDVLLPWEFISLGLSIIWNLANIGVWFTPSRSGRGMHPGANVGCDLILWAILLVTGIFASITADAYIGEIGNGFGYDQPYGNGNDPDPCSPFVNCDALTAYSNGLGNKGRVIAAGLAFTFLLVLLHFALFISACRYTHARRHEQGGRYAKALTEEATVIATQMVRDMGYQPPSQVPMQERPRTETASEPASAAPPSFQPTEHVVLSDREILEPRHVPSTAASSSKGKGTARVSSEQASMTTVR